MADATALSLSRFFSDLTGRPVSFSIAAASSAVKGPQMYGLYDFADEAKPLLLRIHLHTLAVLGGALLGVPEEVAIERAQQSSVDEPLRDAMHEILNIASTAISPDIRIVFRSMSKSTAALPNGVADLMQTACHKTAYRVALEETSPELFTIAH